MNKHDYSDVARDFLSLVELRHKRPDARALGDLTRSFGRFPYENVTKILRAGEHQDIKKRLRTPDIVLGEYLDLGAGGTCFSLTHFFAQILSFSGFQAYPVLCDRSYGPDTHCALIVCLGRDRLLVDPGYLLEEPLLIPEQGESVQRGPSGTLRLTRLGRTDQLLLITEKEGKKKIRYRLKDRPVAPEKFLARWIDSFDWSMMRHLCISRQTGSGQLYLRDGLLRLIEGRGKKQERISAGFAARAEGLFGIDARIVSLAHDALSRERRRYFEERKR